MQPLRDCGLWLFDLAGYMYDAPASFKSWLEHAVQIGLTVDEEWKPLLSGKRVVVISAWGGSEDEVSPELGFASALRKAMKFIGVEDITFFNIFNTEEITAHRGRCPAGYQQIYFGFAIIKIGYYIRKRRY